MHDYHRAIRFISTMAAASILAVFIGHWLDEMLHTTPIIMLALLAYAIGGSFYQLLKDTGDES